MLLLCVFNVFSAETDSVVIHYNNTTKMWDVDFYTKAGVKYKTITVDSTIIGAVNTVLPVAGEGASIDILSPGIVTVAAEDVVGGIAPLSGQTIDFHNHEIKIVNPYNFRMNGIHAIRKHGVTIKNFRLTGNVTYGIWTLGCDDLTIENLDIDMGKESGLAVFIRPRGDYRPRNLTIKGDVFINGGKGHAIEFTSVDTVSIGDVTVTNNIGGCGINASGSTQIKIGNVYGYKNCYSLEGDGGGYATLRYSNAGRFLECKGVYSRRSGRGYFITEGEHSALPDVIGQHNSTVAMVDIKHTVRESILIRGEFPTHNQVLSGTVSESLYTPDRNVFVVGATNSVTLGIPVVPIVDSTVIKTVRINELRFGFYDLTGDENTENYIRDRTCDGFGYARTVDEAGAFMEWNIRSGSGDHRFSWRYASKATKKAKLLLNSKVIKTVEFEGTGSDSLWQSVSVWVQGLNASAIKNIQLVAIEEKGLPFVDFLEVEAPGATFSLKDSSTASDSTHVYLETAVNVKSIYEETLAQFKIYPNPNHGVFYVELNDASETVGKLQVYDVTGSLVHHTEAISGNRIAVQLNDNRKGLYFLRLLNDAGCRWVAVI